MPSLRDLFQTSSVRCQSENLKVTCCAIAAPTLSTAQTATNMMAVVMSFFIFCPPFFSGSKPSKHNPNFYGGLTSFNVDWRLYNPAFMKIDSI
jgi:hypothetical protein